MARKLRSAWTALNRSGLAATALCFLGLTAAAYAADPGLRDRPRLGGDLGGIRPLLAERGVSLDLNLIGETFDNFTGGTRRGATFLDRFELATDIDLEKMIGLPGATVHANGFLVNGHGLSTTNLGNLMPVSGVEARAGVRLFTLWYEQSLLQDRLSLRIGQLAADDEFLISPTAGALLNATFGWAAIAAADLPSGGPAYPLAATGARLRVAPKGGDGPALLAAVFAGDPAGKGIGDPQERNENGTTFSTEGGAFFIAEAQYPINRGKAAAGLPGIYKVGGWYHTGGFDDQRFDDGGISLASAASTGTPRRHRGDYGLYAIADQMLWRRPGTEDQGLSAFLRAGGAPSDRNLVAFYADGGVAYKGLIDGRPDDTLAIGVAQAWLSGDARALDRDRNALSGVAGPLRDSETAIELTYTARLAPWWTLQPDVQFIRHPGGNVADPGDATGQRRVGDAVVLGIRTSLKL